MRNRKLRTSVIATLAALALSLGTSTVWGQNQFGQIARGYEAQTVSAAATRTAPSQRPNILVIWGDDIGYWNISAYNQGMMGYKTDRKSVV